MSKPRKKIMFVIPNYNWVTIIGSPTMWVLWPTQLCLLAAQIEDKYDVKIIDCIIDNISEKDFAEIVRKEKPDLVGISNFTHEYNKAGHKAADIVKSVDPSIITIMGGIYVIGTPRLALENKNIDYAIRGEAEVLIKDFLAYLYEGKEFPSKGIVYRNNGEIVVSPPSDFIQNLDSLKFPAYHLIDFMKYATRYQRETIDGPRKLPFARVHMTRGCPIGCTFCQVESISGGPIRYKSAEYMVREMEELINKYGVKFFIFDDDNLFLHRHKVKEMLRIIIKRKLGIQWLPMTTGMFCLDDELIDLCAESGCVWLDLAIESGSQRVLKEIIKKPVDLSKVTQMAKKIKSVGIALSAHFIIGCPGETWDEVLQSINLAGKLDVDYVKFNIWTPLPDTEMYEMAKERGYLDDKYFNKPISWMSGIDTPQWRYKDLVMLRTYEWERINFSNPDRKKKIVKMMNITEERLDEIRKATREKANPNEVSAFESSKINRYLDITPEEEIPSSSRSSEGVIENRYKN